MLDFNWPKKELYPSFLEIELSFTPRSEVTLERKHLSRMPWEMELGKESYAHIESKLGVKATARKDGISDEPISKQKLLKRWEKFLDLPCELPDTKIWKFDSEALGCFKIKFGNKGKYLAAACTQASSKTLIKVFDIENGELKIVMRGHHDLVHEI